MYIICTLSHSGSSHSTLHLISIHHIAYLDLRITHLLCFVVVFFKLLRLMPFCNRLQGFWTVLNRIRRPVDRPWSSDRLYRNE
jgi:hypothetical protein